MRHNPRPFAILLAPLALYLLPGCGGGSSGTTSLSGVTSSTRAALNVYVTDAFSDQYKQVIATLYKIELTADGTTYTTVYFSDTGQTLDLASLASSAQLLASLTVPTGTYTQARVTFGDHITLVTNAGVSSSVAVSSKVGTDTNGQVAIVVNTPTRVQANQSNTVFVDFKLAEFQLTGSTITPSIGCGGGQGGPGVGGEPGDGLGSKQRNGHLNGTISALSGTTSFTLTGGNGRTLTINLSSATTVIDGQTGAVATLANGQSVIVDGTFDPTTSTVTASAITLNDYVTVQHAQARGTVASVDATAASFVLTVQRADNFAPTAGTIRVVTNAGTNFGKGMHQSGAFTDVAVSGSVNVSGVFNTTTQTLTATFVGLH